MRLGGNLTKVEEHSPTDPLPNWTPEFHRAFNQAEPAEGVVRTADRSQAMPSIPPHAFLAPSIQAFKNRQVRLFAKGIGQAELGFALAPIANAAYNSNKASATISAAGSMAPAS